MTNLDFDEFDTFSEFINKIRTIKVAMKKTGS